MPYYQSPLLSKWPANVQFPVGKENTPIPQEILKNVKMVDFVGYAPNTHTFKRNQYSFTKYQPKEPKFRSEQEREIILGESKKSVGTDSQDQITMDAGIPHYYRKAEIKYSKFGVEDFDFGFYNKTKFGGLENDIQNSYCNSMIQLMFFIWPLREFARGHIRSVCLREPCLMCELGFIFRILESSKGVNCQASNFLRALSQIKQVTALGLIEPEIITTDSNISYGRLIQTFCRFFLEQIHQDAILTSHIFEGDKIIQKLFSIRLRSVSECPDAHRLVREITPFLIDLNYPSDVRKFN